LEVGAQFSPAIQEGHVWHTVAKTVFGSDSRIESLGLLPGSVSQNGDRLARVMITVVKEKDDFTANLLLETPGRQNFSEQKSLWKKSAWLLAETNNRMVHRSERASYPGGSFRAAKDSLL
jgi:hypothetical protein